MAKDPNLDLSEFDYGQLMSMLADVKKRAEEMRTDTEKELKEKWKLERRELKKRHRIEEREMEKRWKAEAVEKALSFEEIMGAPSSQVKKARKKATPKYRHPSDKSLTWSGRGKRPRWLAELLVAGKSLEDLRIA